MGGRAAPGVLLTFHHGAPGCTGDPRPLLLRAELGPQETGQTLLVGRWAEAAAEGAPEDRGLGRSCWHVRRGPCFVFVIGGRALIFYPGDL